MTRPGPARTAALPVLLVGLLTAPPSGSLAGQEPPPPLPERPLEFPGFEAFTLENGLRVVVVPYGTQPVMSARLYARGGRAAEDADLAGLASLTATVLTRGTTSRTAPEISEAIEGVGGSLSASAGQDYFTVSTTVLTEHMGTAFELLEDVVRNASFPEDEVALARRQTLSSLQAELGQAQAVAARRFAAVVYGEDHPYGVGSTPSTVEAIARDDLVAYRDRILRPEGALLVVAGRVTRDEVEERVRRHLGNWSGEASDLPALPEPADPSESRIYLVHRPGSTQSVVAVGHLGIPPDAPDYFSVQVMNRILGGGSDARLFRILRDERGWTYGAYSQFNRPAHRGQFRAGAEVRPEVTDSTVVELLEQLDRMRREAVGEEELEAARSYLAGSFPLRLETADQVAGQLATTLLLDLPLEQLTDYPERIREVTAADVLEAARDRLDPDRAAIVVVGEGGDLLERLEALGPVELFDVRGDRLARDALLGTDEPLALDAGRLQEGSWRYEVLVQDQPMGNAEYELRREGDDWVSRVVITSMGTNQETELRFSARDFTPRAVRQETVQGPNRITADVAVTDGRLTGTVELPQELGGDREYDEVLPPGTLLPGMDEYALAVAEMEEGARFTIPYFNLLEGRVTRLQVLVAGEEEVSLAAGTFPTWVVEVEGGQAALRLNLHREAPHIILRQEFVGQPVEFRLTGSTLH